MQYLFIFLTSVFLFAGQVKSQTIYIATDTLELEIGLGTDLGPNGKNGAWEYTFNSNPANRLKFRATFRNDTLNGPFEAYWPNGEKKIVVNFTMGKKNGKALYYSREGRLKYRMNYERDTLEGAFSEYYGSGIKVKDLNFRKGLLNGVCRTYRDQKKQKLMAEGEFLNGLPNGIYTNWVDKKRIIVEHFENGYPVDNQKIFVSGKLVGELVLDKSKWEYFEIVSYKDGVRVDVQQTPEFLKRSFMYGQYLYLPANFR